MFVGIFRQFFTSYSVVRITRIFFFIIGGNTPEMVLRDAVTGCFNEQDLLFIVLGCILRTFNTKLHTTLHREGHIALEACHTLHEGR
jgi:hypothetical protein